MPNHKFEEYWQAIDALEAQSIIAMINSTVYPDMKKTARSSFWKKINKKAYGIIKKPPVKYDEFVKSLAGNLNNG